MRRIRINAGQSTRDARVTVMWVALGLALGVARGLLAVGDLALADDAVVLFYLAAGCYLVGSLPIMLRRRWLWALPCDQHPGHLVLCAEISEPYRSHLLARWRDHQGRPTLARTRPRLPHRSHMDPLEASN